jgi:RNA polymerase sigma-70 factor, ECF subfamily
MPSEQDSARSVVDSLFREWYPSLVRYAFRVCGSMETAEDVVQEALTELYRALVQGKAIESPRAWTLCVVRRGLVDQQREQFRHGGAFLAFSDIEEQADRTAPPAPRGWEEDRLTRLLSVLSARQEEVLLLRVQGLKYRQIAAQLKIGTNSVKTLLARAVKKMQQASTDSAPTPRSSRTHGDTIQEPLQ